MKSKLPSTGGPRVRTTRGDVVNLDSLGYYVYTEPDGTYRGVCESFPGTVAERCGSSHAAFSLIKLLVAAHTIYP